MTASWSKAPASIDDPATPISRTAVWSLSLSYIKKESVIIANTTNLEWDSAYSLVVAALGSARTVVFSDDSVAPTSFRAALTVPVKLALSS